MISRILVAVDDSPPALAGADAAIDLAVALGADLRFVSVADPGVEADGLLRHVAARARRHGVGRGTDERDDVAAAGAAPSLRPAVSTMVIAGSPPYEVVLDAALEWRADLIVMGRSDTRASGRRYVGSQTEHLLEFASVPVMVVPGPS